MRRTSSSPTSALSRQASVDVYKRQPLTAEQTRRLHEKLEKVTGRHIDLKTKVEPAVLGGIRLDIEGTELDGTVRSRLAGLRSSIAAATL